MYITCPSCNTSFLINEEQIGPNGRRVKCSSCDYLWLALPDTVRKDNNKFISEQKQTSKSDTLDYIPEPGVNLPVVMPNYAPIISQSIILCGVVSLILVGIITLNNKLSWHHIYNGTISQLSASITKANINKNNNTIMVRYSITNTSAAAIQSPLVRINMLDEKKQVTDEYVTNKSDIVIYPHDTLTLETTIENAPHDVKAISLNLGDQLDFLMK